MVEKVKKTRFYATKVYRGRDYFYTYGPLRSDFLFFHSNLNLDIWTDLSSTLSSLFQILYYV